MQFNFKTGDAVEIKREGKIYRTIVENQYEDGSILMYSPIEKGRVLTIRPDEILEFMYVILDNENGKYDVYSFTGKIISRELIDGIPVLKVEPLSVAKRVQRRSFYRLSIVKPLLIERVDSDETIEIITRDISAGGMLAISPKRLEVNEEYLVYVNIFNESPLVLSGKILSCDKGKEDEYRYIVRFCFTNIDKKVQSDMIRQINQLQVMEIRRMKNSSPAYKDAIRTYLDDELLDRFNLDNIVDSRSKYLMALNIVLLLMFVVVFAMSIPKKSFLPLLSEQKISTWNIEMLKIDFFLSLAMMLNSGLGLIYDRFHYSGRKQANLFFVVMLILSIIFLLSMVTTITRLV